MIDLPKNCVLLKLGGNVSIVEIAAINIPGVDGAYPEDIGIAIGRAVTAMRNFTFRIDQIMACATTETMEGGEALEGDTLDQLRVNFESAAAALADAWYEHDEKRRVDKK